MKPITVNVIVLTAKGLKSKTGKHKFCVHVKVGKNKQKTNITEDLFGNPSFNKEFVFSVDNLKNDLKLKVTEKNDKDVLGQVVVPLTELCPGGNHKPERVPLRVHKKCSSPTGELLFDAWVSGSGPTGSQIDLAKNSTSRESLKSLGSSGFKKLKEKLHSSALKLNHSSETKKGHGSMFGAKTKGSVGAKGGSSLSCQDLSGSSAIFRPRASIPEESFRCDAFELDSEGSASRKSSDDSGRRFVAAPEVTGLSPSSGDCRGGTVVAIRGTSLGTSADDVIHVRFCGTEMLDRTKYISSQKLICTTLPCSPTTGDVVVETRSGGVGTSAVKFSFVDSQSSNESESPTSSGRGKTQFRSADSFLKIESKPVDVPSDPPFVPPRINRKKELGVIKESLHDGYSDSSSKKSESGFSKTHKKEESLSRSSIFLAINQSPPSSSKRFSLFNPSTEDLISGVSKTNQNDSTLVHVENSWPSSNSSSTSLDKPRLDAFGGSAFGDGRRNRNQEGRDAQSGEGSKFSSSNGNGNFAKTGPVSEAHDFSTPEGIQMFYNHSDVGLAERLREYYPRPTANKTSDLVPKQEAADDKPYNKHLSNVVFSIAGDSSSDDESLGKKSKAPTRPDDHRKISTTSDDKIENSKNFSDSDVRNGAAILVDADLSQKAEGSQDVLTNQISVKQVVEIQPISRQTVRNITNGNTSPQADSPSVGHSSPLEIKEDSDALLDKTLKNSPTNSTSSLTQAPVKPPRVRELVGLNKPVPKFPQSSSAWVPEKSSEDIIQLNPPSSQIFGSNAEGGDDEDDDENVKRLKDEIAAKEVSLQELRLQNKTLQEERNLLRRYIEVLISRALTTCPEILCNDAGKISLS